MLLMPDSIIADPDGTEWKVGAALFTGGERYYMLLDSEQTTWLIPAADIHGWSVIKLVAS